MEESEKIKLFVKMYEIQSLRLIWYYGDKVIVARLTKWFTDYGYPTLAEIKKTEYAHLVEGLKNGF